MENQYKLVQIAADGVARKLRKSPVAVAVLWQEYDWRHEYSSICDA